MNPNPQRMLPAGPVAPARRHELLFAVLGFLVGVVAASLWFTEHNFVAMRETVPEAEHPAQKTGPVIVRDQSAGDAVTIESVDVPAPGAWVAVAEMRGDSVWNVLGANHTFGPAEDFTVRLLRATVPGMTYAVVLYRDDGDGQFDLHKDSIYVDEKSGERVVSPFRANL